MFRSHPEKAQPIVVSDGLLNLTTSSFNSSHPTKVIIHGYSSGMDLDVLVDIRKGTQTWGSY
jgi:hypothetical protein